jgi:RNA recognition motif-containing protein
VSEKKLYVANLVWGATDHDLRELFEPFGTVTRCVVASDDGGRAKGFGFVDLADVTDDGAAALAMNGKDFKGRPLIVAESKPRVRRFEQAKERPRR